jgi:hypothetical protein
MFRSTRFARFAPYGSCDADPVCTLWIACCGTGAGAAAAERGVGAEDFELGSFAGVAGGRIAVFGVLIPAYPSSFCGRATGLFVGGGF